MNTVLLTPPVRKLGLFYSWKGSAAGGGLIQKDPRSASQASAESTWVTLGVDAEQGEGAVSHSAAFSEEAGSLWDTHTAGDGSCGFRQTCKQQPPWQCAGELWLWDNAALFSFSGSEAGSGTSVPEGDLGDCSFCAVFSHSAPRVVLKTLYSHHHWMDFLSHSAQCLSLFGSSFKSSGMSFGEREREKILKFTPEISTDWSIGFAKAPAYQIRLLTTSRTCLYSLSMLSKVHIRVIHSKLADECSGMYIISNYMGVWGRRIICALKFDASLSNIDRPCFSQ